MNKMSPPRVAIVTGADVNLGRSMALALLQAGHCVVLSSLSQPGLDAVLEESGSKGAQAIGVAADLSQVEECFRIVRAAIEAFGRVDMVVNNAALTPETLWPNWLVEGEPAPWELDAALYRRFLNIDAVAPHVLMSEALPQMLQRKWGRLVNVTTSLDTMLRFWPYGSAKAALEAQTAVLATRLAGTGVTANVLVPGGFTKPGPLHLSNGKVIHPQLSPEIMAAPIQWLASDASGDFSSRRLLAGRWNPRLAAPEAAAAASHPVGWPVESQMAVQPAVKNAVD